MEFNVRLPGKSSESGFWAATWLMGNLGRAGHYPSLEGMWPFSYDGCANGDGAHSWNDNKTQRISRCSAPKGTCCVGTHWTTQRMTCGATMLRKIIHMCLPPALSNTTFTIPQPTQIAHWDHDVAQCISDNHCQKCCMMQQAHSLARVHVC